VALVEEGLLLARARHDRWDEAWCLNLLGVTSYGQDDLAGAGSRFEEVLRLLRDLGDPRFLAVTLGNAGWVATALGDTDRAAACYREQVPLALAVGDPYLLAWGLDGVAAVAVQRGRDAPTARLLGAAAAIRAAAGDAVPGVVAARRDRYVARARTRLGDGAFAAAWQAGQALSAPDAVADALAVLAEPSVPAPAAAPHGLTPRELEVLGLLARHWTDKEIAAALFVSPRTVTSHVTGILTKLGVGSRREAAAAAAREGLVELTLGSPSP
jgi:DNA-binding CsgD family transcriptional regulator